MPYSMQKTEQIPNEPPKVGAGSTTTSKHPSTPYMQVNIELLYIVIWRDDPQQIRKVGPRTL